MQFHLNGYKPADPLVEDADPSVAERPGGLPAEVDVPNADGALIAGLLADVRLKALARQGVLVIPSEALLREGSDAVVYVAASDVARRRVVRPGYDSGVQVEIQQGLTDGDVVLIGGRGLLREGTRVEVAR